MKAVTEEELKAKAVAPRVTQEEFEANIAEKTFYQHGLLTICVLTLANGFTVTGESACADPANFDPDIGQRLAEGQAKNKIWPLMGYELRTKVAMVQSAMGPSHSGMTTHVGTKVIHAKPMTRLEYNQFRGWELPSDENGDDEGYLVEYADGGSPNVIGWMGYVSWSPKDVFDRAYGPALGSRSSETWADRLVREAKELRDKVNKLGHFLTEQKTCDLDARLAQDDLDMLNAQYGHMCSYLWTLDQRIKKLPNLGPAINEANG